MDRTVIESSKPKGSPALAWSSLVLRSDVLPKATIGQVLLARRILAGPPRRGGRD